MGVPKFFRWLSERYPKILQRHGRPADEELAAQHGLHDRYQAFTAQNANPCDPLSTCGLLPPPIDHLYIDMNGILHCCAHNNLDDEEGLEDDQATTSHNNNFDQITPIAQTQPITMGEITQSVGYYLDRLVKEVAQPRHLLYIAIDGVAPRAKLNQQRARRYQNGQEQTLSQTIYEAHVQALQQQQQQNEVKPTTPTVLQGRHATTSSSSSSSSIHEITQGRFTGKLQATVDTDMDRTGTSQTLNTTTNDEEDEDTTAFHPASITPGTSFFQSLEAWLLDFLQTKLQTDPDWQKLTVIVSGAQVPGEGEHKLLQHIRQYKNDPNSDPNIRHCLFGQDGDLIMLGLATHEPNLLLLREQVLFDRKRRSMAQHFQQLEGVSDSYIFNPNFEFLHMNVLRDYFALEFETSNWFHIPNNNNTKKKQRKQDAFYFDLERTIDDFVFLSFFIGNDFLPHMPALDIADEAFDLLFFAYREERQKWLQQEERQWKGSNKKDVEPYLTYAGEIVSGKRLESFLQVIGAHEVRYYDYKKATHDPEALRKIEARYGKQTTPSDQILQSKEDSDRQKYRQMLLSQQHKDELDDGFAPVMSSQRLPSDISWLKGQANTSEQKRHQAEEAEKEGLLSRMGELLQFTVPSAKDVKGPPGDGVTADDLTIDDQDVKGRYYYDKFGFTPYDVDKHKALRKSYVEGLVWNLKYYYEGCVSWEWYYPYHYGPMISDLVDLDDILEEISFEGRMGEPLNPFEQLLACLPPSHSKLLPKPFRPLMTDPNSPIVDFYPRSFTIDMNGKRWPWEAAVLLPFIDSSRLLEAVHTVDTSSLTEEEKRRNTRGEALVLSYDAAGNDSSESGVDNADTEGVVSIIPFETSPWNIKNSGKQPVVFRPEIRPGTPVPGPGLPTLRNGPLVSMWRKQLGVNVHGSRSRYQTACLELDNPIPEILPIEKLATQLVGTIIYINYPHLIEAFVTGISDSKSIIVGPSKPRPWTGKEAVDRKDRLFRAVSSYVFGEKLVGTGGVALAHGGTPMEELETLLHVRPLAGLKELPDGQIGKTFAKFEVEVPMFATSWAPYKEDPRLYNLPAILEKDPYTGWRTSIEVAQQWKQKQEPMSHQGERSSSSFGAGPRLLESTQGFCTLARGGVSRNRVPPLAKGLSSSTSHLVQPSVACLMPRRITQFRPQRIATRSSPRVPSRGRFLTIGIAAAAFFATVVASISPDQWTTMGRTSTEVISPRSETRPHQFDAGRQAPPLEFAHGTTTVSFTFRDGIIVAVDSRASLGSFVGSKTVEKVLPINSHMLGTMAGGAADCSFWIRKLRAEAAHHELASEEGNEGIPRRMSVSYASRLLSNALYSNRGLGLSIGTMIAGFDDDPRDPQSPPKIYYVDNTGMRIESDMFAVGSGSTFALGILDTERKHDMTPEEAVALGIKAIRHATFRDAYSGGFINIYLITRKDGWKRVFSEDLARLSE